jgi:predicted secreted Zn-dependent protease
VNSLLGVSGAILAALAVCLAPAAGAKPLTNYVHYLVAGNSAQGLFESMISNGPRVGAGKAYASTRMDPNVSASTVQAGGQCRVASFKMNMTFTIRLPQLANDQNIEPTLRRSFERFYHFAKRHEENHRTIWLQCAAEAEALATGVEAGTCSEAEARSLKIVEEVSKRCDKRHSDFDAADQKQLSRHPFMRQALFRLRTAPQEAALASTKQQQSDLRDGALAGPQ